MPKLTDELIRLYALPGQPCIAHPILSTSPIPPKTPPLETPEPDATAFASPDLSSNPDPNSNQNLSLNLSLDFAPDTAAETVSTPTPPANQPRPETLSDALIHQGLDAATTEPWGLSWLDTAQQARCFVIQLARSSDWPLIETLYQSLGDPLGLSPNALPALALQADGGYQLWFSFEQPIPLTQGQALLAGLKARFFSTLSAEQCRCLPIAADEGAQAPLLPIIPHRSPSAERWAAFIDPALGGLFAEETGLDIRPNLEGQAQRLAQHRPIKGEELHFALTALKALLNPKASAQATPSSAPPAPSAPPNRYQPAPPSERADANPAAGPDSLQLPYADPRSFLLAVMNTPTAPLALRIQAATALLPHANPENRP